MILQVLVADQSPLRACNYTSNTHLELQDVSTVFLDPFFLCGVRYVEFGSQEMLGSWIVIVTTLLSSILYIKMSWIDI